MIDFSIMQLFPDFLLADKNGFAMAKAIGKALQIMCDTVQTGVDTVQNVDKMPEWRLDEMAWELGCLYDYNASIDAKRKWIRDATPLFAAYGTPQAIYNFLEGFFDSVEVEENWQYGGDAFHFRVTVSGKWTDANEAWARMAIAAAKNVRSVLDSLAVGTSAVIVVHGEGKVLAKFPYVMTGPDRLAGTWPQDNVIGKITSGNVAIAAKDARPYPFPYPLAGTKPQENTIGRAVSSAVIASHAAEGHVFPYPAASENTKSGTIPQENTQGIIAKADAAAQSDGKATAFSYAPCASEKLCGDDAL